jgi:hypothetical protein
MLSVKGTLKNGVVYLEESIPYPDGHPVIITFLDTTVKTTSPSQEISLSEEEYNAGWDALEAVLSQCAVETGLTDLAHQHDRYLYGTPKKNDVNFE